MQHMSMPPPPQDCNELYPLLTGLEWLQRPAVWRSLRFGPSKKNLHPALLLVQSSVTACVPSQRLQ